MNGQKPRDVSKKRKRAANRLLGKLENDLADYEGTCLFVTDHSGGFCGKPVSNNCHIVSESTVLHGLRDSKTKKVLELQWGVGPWRKVLFSDNPEQFVQNHTTFDPSERTTHDACVAWFACKLRAHDDEFRPIDVAQPDFCDPVVRFLSAYRMYLYLADQYRQGLEVHEEWSRTAMRNSNPRRRALWLTEKWKLEKGGQAAGIAAALLGKNWHARKTGGPFDLDVVSARVFTFRSKLMLAGGVSYGKATAVTVFPIHGDLHNLAVFNLTSESHIVERDVERLAKVAAATEESEDIGVTVTHELMTNGWGSFALSPESYRALNDEERYTIQSVVARHSRNEEIIRSIPPRPSIWKGRRK